MIQKLQKAWKDIWCISLGFSDMESDNKNDPVKQNVFLLWLQGLPCIRSYLFKAADLKLKQKLKQSYV